jgi:pseudoazurin
MIRPRARLALLAALALGFSNAAFAQGKEVVVNMLNAGKDGLMVFEPAFVRVNVGDTVVFKPTQIGAHNSVSLLVPPGATPWSGPLDKETRVRIEKEGVYLYACLPHKAMGMVGVIQAGKPVNLAAARELARKESAAMAMGKDRFDKALAQVK